MNLNKGQKIVLGIFTALPFVLFPFFIFHLFYFIIDMAHHHRHDEPDVANVLTGIFTFTFPLIITGLLTLALLIFYIIHALNNKKITSTEQVIWILIFIFIGTIGFPIYWVMRIWNENP